MREILFRGKRADNGEWVEGDLDRGLFANIDFISYFKTIGERLSFEVIPETVGQYTGLTDKNDKKIFEGDIVKLFLVDDVEVGLIKWSAIDVRHKFASPDGTDYGVNHTCVFEIVGNIYDNPELLGGE